MKFIKNGVVHPALVEIVALQGLVATYGMPPQTLNDLLQEEWVKAKEGTFRSQLSGRFPTATEQSFLDQLGTAVIPVDFNTRCEGTLLLGGTLKSVARRVAFLIAQLLETGYSGIPEPLYLLGSSRVLDPKQEMPEHVSDILRETGATFTRNFEKDVRTPNCWPLSEIEMMERVIDWTEFNPSRLCLVLAPTGRTMEGVQRPANTAETIKAWIEIARPGHYLVVSSQPFCENQLMAVERAVKEAGAEGYTFDVCGPAAPPLPLSRWLDNLAKQLWEEVQLLPKA